MVLDPSVAQPASDGEESQRLRVYLVEDQTVLRECLVASLELAPDVIMIGEAPDAERALEDLRIADTDVVLMDVGLPGMSGIEATRRLKERKSGLRVVILTAHENEYLDAAISAGADAYLQKSCSRQELLHGIRVADASPPHPQTVILQVVPPDSMGRVVELVRDLRQEPNFKLLQIDGNFSTRVSISVALRGPLDLPQVVLAMDSVAEVGTLRLPSAEPGDAAITVRLVKGPTDNEALCSADEDGQLSFAGLM